MRVRKSFLLSFLPCALPAGGAGAAPPRPCRPPPGRPPPSTRRPRAGGGRRPCPRVMTTRRRRTSGPPVFCRVNDDFVLIIQALSLCYKSPHHVILSHNPVVTSVTSTPELAAPMPSRSRRNALVSLWYLKRGEEPPVNCARVLCVECGRVRRERGMHTPHPPNLLLLTHIHTYIPCPRSRTARSRA